MSWFRKCSKQPLSGWGNKIENDVITYGAGSFSWDTMDVSTRKGVLVDLMEKNKTKLNCAYDNPQYQGLIKELREYSLAGDNLMALKPDEVWYAVFAVFIKNKAKESRTTLKKQQGSRNLMAKLGGRTRRRRTKKRKSRRRRKRTKKRRRKKRSRRRRRR